MKEIIILLSLFIFNKAFSLENYEKLDLVAILLKNNNIVKAKSVLQSIDDPKDVETDRFYLLQGALLIKDKQYEKALTSLKEAKKFGINKRFEMSYLDNLATVYLRLKRYSECKKHLAMYQNKMNERAHYYQVKSNLLIETFEKEKGWNVLLTGSEKFPKSLALKKQMWFFLMQNNLVNESIELLRNMINHYQITSIDLLKFSYLYKEKNEEKVALSLIEMAVLKSPDDENFTRELASLYIKKEAYLSAAQVFEKLALLKDDYYKEASELFRQAGFYKHSDNLSLKIKDYEDRVKQRVVLALQVKNFDYINQISEFVNRTSLKKNEDMQYTFAYSQFMKGNFKKAQQYLKVISSPKLIKKSFALKEAIENCRLTIERCL